MTAAISASAGALPLAPSVKARISSAIAVLRAAGAPFTAGSSTISATVPYGSACSFWNRAAVSRKLASGSSAALPRLACSLRMAAASLARRQASEPALPLPAAGAWPLWEFAGGFRQPRCGLERARVVELGEAQQLVGRHVQRGAHLVDQRQAGLDLRPLVARVAVFLDAERFGEVARAIEPALRANDLQALRELRTYVGSEHFGHDARGFAHCAHDCNHAK